MNTKNMDIGSSSQLYSGSHSRANQHSNFHKFNDFISAEDTNEPEATHFLDLSDLNEYNHYEKLVDQSRTYDKRQILNQFLVKTKQSEHGAKQLAFDQHMLLNLDDEEDQVHSPILSEADEVTGTNQHQYATVSPTKIEIQNQSSERFSKAYSHYDAFNSHPLVKAKSSDQLINKYATDLGVGFNAGPDEEFEATTHSLHHKSSREELKADQYQQDQFNEEDEILDNLENIDYICQEEINMNDSQIQIMDARKEDMRSNSLGGLMTVPDFGSVGNDKSFNIEYLNCTVITSQQKSNINFGLSSSKSTMSGSHIQQSQSNARYSTVMEYINGMNNPTSEDSPLRPVFLQVETKSLDGRVRSANTTKQSRKGKSSKSKSSKKSEKTILAGGHHTHSNSQQLLIADFKSTGSISTISVNTKSRRGISGGSNSPVSKKPRDQNRRVMFKDEVSGGELCQIKEFKRNHFKCTNGCCEPDPDEDGGKISCACLIF